jgi:hypothetical protein
VQKKQQPDGEIRQPVEPDGCLPVHGQQAGEDHRADEAQREVIGKQFRASHFAISTQFG